jgi:hypothetical protein
MLKNGWHALKLTLTTGKFMTPSPHPDSPPSDFVAFLAQRSGLSEEAAEHRLEDWLGEYYASASQRSSSASAASVSLTV